MVFLIKTFRIQIPPSQGSNYQTIKLSKKKKKKKKKKNHKHRACVDYATNFQ
jgi:hypothetical protein